MDSLRLLAAAGGGEGTGYTGKQPVKWSRVGTTAQVVPGHTGTGWTGFKLAPVTAVTPTPHHPHSTRES